MILERVTYTGPTFDDRQILNELPASLAAIILEENGVVAFGGGFHIRGACHNPPWHSLREAWRGSSAFHCNYPNLRPTDIPFAEDALGDQFVLREEVVHRLATETGDLQSLATDVVTFIAQIEADPITTLSLEPLVAFERTGGRLEPGQLLSVYPPYCVGAEGARSFRAIASSDRLDFLASLARQIRDLPDGTAIRLEFES
jgi:hypothetical protein